MIKVLHIFSGYGGGVSSVVWNLIKNVDDNVITQSIMCFSMEGGESMAADVRSKGGSVYIMPRKHINGLVPFFIYLNETIKSGMFDVIHCHIDGIMALIFRLYAIKAGVKHFIVHAHQSADKYGNQDTKKLKVVLRQLMTNIAVDIRFSCGRQAGDYVFGKRANKRACIINNCIDETKYKDVLADHVNLRMKLCEELNIVENTLLIGHVGRFDYPKNHKFLVEIAKSLKNREASFAMILVGDGALFDDINDLVKAVKLEKNIYLLGRRYDVPQLMSAFDIVLLPSLSEGFPTVALEAQACGTPIIISEKVTRDADIGLEITDYLPIGNADIWADKIIQGMPYKKANSEHVSNILLEKRYWSNLVGLDYKDKILQIVKAKG